MADKAKGGDAEPSPAGSPSGQDTDRPATRAKRGSEQESQAGTHKRTRLSGVGKKAKAGSDAVRNRVASVVWLVAVLAAVALGVGTLLIALDANQANAMVGRVLDTARIIDGPFWKVFEFEQDNGRPDKTMEALVNWGLAAAVYLIVGRIADKVIRP